MTVWITCLAFFSLFFLFNCLPNCCWCFPFEKEDDERYPSTQSTISRITCKLFALICLWSHHLTRLENWRGLFNVHFADLFICVSNLEQSFAGTCFSPCLVPKRPHADFCIHSHYISIPPGIYVLHSCPWQNTLIFLEFEFIALTNLDKYALVHVIMSELVKKMYICSVPFPTSSPTLWRL